MTPQSIANFLKNTNILFFIFALKIKYKKSSFFFVNSEQIRVHLN